MAGLCPGHPRLLASALEDVGARHKAGHDAPNGEAVFNVGAACRAEPARSMTHGRTASTNAAESRQQMASKVQPGRELPMMM
jgi:hypothetical protein